MKILYLGSGMKAQQRHRASNNSIYKRIDKPERSLWFLNKYLANICQYDI